MKRARGASLTICNTARDRPWTCDGFKTAFGKADDAARIDGLTFHGFRGTAVVRLACAGCTVPEIASLTGHTLQIPTKFGRSTICRVIATSPNPV